MVLSFDYCCMFSFKDVSSVDSIDMATPRTPEEELAELKL